MTRTLSRELTHHFAPEPWIYERAHQHFAAVYKAAGLTPPGDALPVFGILRAHPTAEQVVAQLAAELVTGDPDNAEQWVADAITKVHRAEAAAFLNERLERHRTSIATRQTSKMVQSASANLRPAFDKAAKALANAAAKLPAEPLDLAAIVASDTTKEMKAAAQALSMLGQIGSIFPFLRGIWTPQAASLGRVVNFPAVPPEIVPSGDDDKNPTRDAIRRAIREAHTSERGIDTVLVDVARGRYDGLTLALPASHKEYGENLERAEAAHVTRKGSTWGGRPRLPR